MNQYELQGRVKKFIDNTFLKTSLELDISEEDLKEKIQALPMLYLRLVNIRVHNMCVQLIYFVINTSQDNISLLITPFYGE